MIIVSKRSESKEEEGSPHIRPVLIESHIPHEQNFAPVDEAGERAVD